MLSSVNDFKLKFLPVLEIQWSRSYVIFIIYEIHHLAFMSDSRSVLIPLLETFAIDMSTKQIVTIDIYFEVFNSSLHVLCFQVYINTQTIWSVVRK